MSSNKKTRPARRRSSFKLRITVWITLLIAVVSSLGIGGILITGSQIADSRLQNELISTVERNVDEIEYKNGILEIENDFAFFVDEVYCNVFDSSGRYIDGESPAALITARIARTAWSEHSRQTGTNIIITTPVSISTNTNTKSTPFLGR